MLLGVFCISAACPNIIHVNLGICARDQPQGSEWSAEDWTGLASQVESQV